MQQRIRSYDVVAWAGDFFEQLTKVKATQLQYEIKFVDSTTKVELLTEYAAATKRLLLLDYDGSLVPFAKSPMDAVPPPGLLQTLSDLTAQPQNDVYIVSGRDSHTLETWLGHLPLGLVAEHGAKIRHVDGNWETAPQAWTTDWKHNVEEVMQRFSARCPKSFVEHKEFSLAWHYRNMDITERQGRAKELYEDLRSLLARAPLQVLHGNKVIEVRIKGVHKGAAIEQILAEGLYDFIFCVGDDKTDEDMFRKVARIPQAFSIKVGNEASYAKYNLHTPAMVQSLLENMAQYAFVPERLAS